MVFKFMNVVNNRGDSVHRKRNMYVCVGRDGWIDGIV